MLGLHESCRHSTVPDMFPTSGDFPCDHTFDGQTRLRGWPKSNLLGLTAWFSRRNVSQEVDRFLAAARA